MLYSGVCGHNLFPVVYRKKLLPEDRLCHAEWNVRKRAPKALLALCAITPNCLKGLGRHGSGYIREGWKD